jgi:hypothetical protein
MSNKLLTDEEQKMFTRNLQRREDMVDVIFKEGTPEDTRFMRLANEVMNANDDALLRLMKIRQEEEKTEDGNIQAIIGEAIKQTALAMRQGIPEVPDSMVPTEVMEGELDDGIVQLDLADFIEGDNDE